MKKKTIKDIDVAGKRVFVRLDFNVPLKGGEITDDTRIRDSIPTIQHLLQNGARVVMCSHLGRPKGEFNLKYSLKPVAERLNQYLDGKVIFASDVIGEDAKTKANALKNGQALLLENVRFHKEEEAGDPEFAKKLADYCEVYVGDAFGAAHRPHASISGIAAYVKTAVAGLLTEKEIGFMGAVLDNPEHPFVMIIGGAKIADKIGVIENLLKKANTILIGGGMAFTFLAAEGVNVGKSLVEHDKKELALDILKQAKERGVKIVLPVDVRVAARFPEPIDEVMDFKNVKITEIEDGMMGLDIGEETSKLFSDIIRAAKTVVWNGPMGVFENPVFSTGTKAVASALASSGAFSVVGGGDSAAAVTQMGLADKISHVSTGGGSSLEFLQGLPLPGIVCLNDK